MYHLVLAVLIAVIAAFVTMLNHSPTTMASGLSAVLAYETQRAVSEGKHEGSARARLEQRLWRDLARPGSSALNEAIRLQANRLQGEMRPTSQVLWQ